MGVTEFGVPCFRRLIQVKPTDRFPLDSRWSRFLILTSHGKPILYSPFVIKRAECLLLLGLRARHALLKGLWPAFLLPITYRVADVDRKA
jgi:hypothetical protein